MLKITIVGLGQIGASVGLALAAQQELLQRVGHDRLGRVHDLQRVVDSHSVEAPFTAGSQEPLPERGRELRPVQILQAQSLPPRLAVVLLPEQVGVKVIDPEAKKRVPLGCDKPPPPVLLDTKEAGGFELLSGPPAEAVPS